MHYQFIASINHVSSSDWDALQTTAQVFLKHRFLKALEDSQSACKQTGWQPQHLLIFEADKLIGAVPCYLKHHSYGEYVFDWAFADAYHRHGLDYYPKLLSAIPFTPVTGPRLLSQQCNDELLQFAQQAFLQHSQQLGLSSCHILFTQKSFLLPKPWLKRQACHFQWLNKDYTSFEHFLQSFTSRKRKMVNKERLQVETAGFSIKRFTDTAITPELLAIFHRCYQQTYAKYAGHSGYLKPEFFKQLTTLADNTLLVIAYQQDTPVAAALYFYDSFGLYGRYWGSLLGEAKALHFECCYYQGIEFAIENKLPYFDPGVQGEHKIVRGFTPTITESWHYFEHPDFCAAIADYIQQENTAVLSYQQHAKQKLPFKQEPT